MDQKLRRQPLSDPGPSPVKSQTRPLWLAGWGVRGVGEQPSGRMEPRVLEQSLGPCGPSGEFSRSFSPAAGSGGRGLTAQSRICSKGLREERGPGRGAPGKVSRWGAGDTAFVQVQMMGTHSACSPPKKTQRGLADGMATISSCDHLPNCVRSTRKTLNAEVETSLMKDKRSARMRDTEP